MSEFPKDNGICLTCADKDNCPVGEMLPVWREILKEYKDPKTERPDLFDEFSVDEPDVEDGIITWCPMYYEKLHVKAAAYIRNDGVIASGRSHADIIHASPYGTCKEGSTSGFLDSNNQFISRERAYRIALEAGQLKTENLRPRNRKYLFSEDIWSPRDNGDWIYDNEKGYVRK